MNCKAPLHGPYCSSCGQRHEPHVHSLLEFAAEAFESLTHADSRLWRTLWLLLSKPGFLTNEFFEGRRARYLPPFRLYIVMSVLLFLVITLIGAIGDKADLAEVNLAKTTADGNVTVSTPSAGETEKERAERICREANVQIPSLSEQESRDACVRALRDSASPLLQALLHNVPKALFLLLPLLALVTQLMYWRRRYVEHLLFFIHNHAFTFALYAILIGVSAIFGGWVAGICVMLMFFYPPIYTYRAMRRVFPQNRWLTRLKFGVLVFAYGNLMFILAIATFSYSVATL